MAYSEPLAERIRAILESRDAVREINMFGGLCFMVSNHMTCGIVGDTLMLRLGEPAANAALKKPHVREMDFTGAPMKAMVFVDPPGFSTDKALAHWLSQALTFIDTLGTKQPRPRRAHPNSH